jgi:hypothetical protein
VILLRVCVKPAALSTRDLSRGIYLRGPNVIFAFVGAYLNVPASVENRVGDYQTPSQPVVRQGFAGRELRLGRDEFQAAACPQNVNRRLGDSVRAVTAHRATSRVTRRYDHRFETLNARRTMPTHSCTECSPVLA